MKIIYLNGTKRFWNFFVHNDSKKFTRIGVRTSDHGFALIATFKFEIEPGDGGQIFYGIS